MLYCRKLVIAEPTPASKSGTGTGGTGRKSLCQAVHSVASPGARRIPASIVPTRASSTRAGTRRRTASCRLGSSLGWWDRWARRHACCDRRSEPSGSERRPPISGCAGRPRHSCRDAVFRSPQRAATHKTIHPRQEGSKYLATSFGLCGQADEAEDVPSPK